MKVDIPNIGLHHAPRFIPPDLELIDVLPKQFERFQRRGMKRLG